MAIKLVSEVGKLACSHLEQPSDPRGVLINMIKFSIWGSLGTGCVAGVSALFSGNMIVRSAIAPYVFKASLISCGALTVFAIYLIYKFKRLPPLGEKELNAQTMTLERGLYLAFLFTGVIATGVSNSLKTPPTIKTLAVFSIHPLLWIGITMVATRLFHLYQHQQMRKQ